MAAATATGVAACQAEAAVRYSGVQDIDIPQFNSQPLSIDSDAYADILLKNYVFGGGNYQGATVSYAPGRAVGFQPNALFYARALSDGYVIDSSSAGPASTVSLAYGASNPNAEFNNAQGSFIGLSFPIGGALPENLHYGWVRVTIDNSAGTFVINDWAFNDVPGEAILAGELPQPLKGDFNNDGSVTTADYTVWRDNLGADESNGVLNGNGTGGTVDGSDYEIWKANFGKSTFTGAPILPVTDAGNLREAVVPEPSTLGLLAAGAMGIAALRRLRESRS